MTADRRREKYGLRVVDSFEKAIQIRPKPVYLPPLKSTAFWDSAAFQSLLALQQQIETEAELESRKAQLNALMKRVAAERRLPIEDIKRAVRDMSQMYAYGHQPGGDHRPPGGLPGPGNHEGATAPTEEMLGGEAMAALMNHLAVTVPETHAASATPSEASVPQELKIHSILKLELGHAAAEHEGLSISTQAEEARRALLQREEEMRLAKQKRDKVHTLFSLENAGAAASAVGHAGLFVVKTALAIPSAVAQGSAALGAGLDSLAGAAGAASEGVQWLTEEPDIVVEARERALPYTSALESIRLESQSEDGEDRPVSAVLKNEKRRAVARGDAQRHAPASSTRPVVAGSRRSSSVGDRRGDAMANVVGAMKGVVGGMRSMGFIGPPIGGQPSY